VKIIALFLFLASLVQGQASELMETIRAEAAELLAHKDPKANGEQLLIGFYSQRIDEISYGALKKNPEIVYRRACAYINTMDEYNKVEQVERELLHDLQFVMDYSEFESRLFQAAKLHFVEIKKLYKYNNYSQRARTHAIWLDEQLRQWAPGSKAITDKLRYEVWTNLQKSEEMCESFADFLLCYVTIPDITLGYVVIDKAYVDSIFVDESFNQAFLFCVIKYHNPLTPSEECSLEIYL
jgi:hypothetical protein